MGRRMLSFQEDKSRIARCWPMSIDAMRKADWADIVCKIDMEKAYDHANWGYLNWVLDQTGFGTVDELD